jgi:hypothetical protein
MEAWADARECHGSSMRSRRAPAESAIAFHIAGDPPAVRICVRGGAGKKERRYGFPKGQSCRQVIALALPDHRAALRCSAALSVTSSTAAGKSVLSISTVTPDITASSEGYDGKFVTGISALTAPSFFAGDNRLYWNLQYQADFSASYCAALT